MEARAVRVAVAPQNGAFGRLVHDPGSQDLTAPGPIPDLLGQWAQEDRNRGRRRLGREPAKEDCTDRH